MKAIYDVMIVGGGMAGLTAAAYLCRAGRKVLLCEKEKQAGGLVNSFNYKGFTFDGGIRAMENSGIIIPMLKQLGLDLAFVRSKVSIGIGQEMVSLENRDSLQDYLDLLARVFPESDRDIQAIGREIKRVMQQMDILYGIDNPLFRDMMHDTRYVFRTVLPWLFQYLFTIGKIGKLNTPITDYLKQFTGNQMLIDMIAQHFFQATPAFFALSYFSLYLDYHYPKGGTGALVQVMAQDILDHGGEVKTDTEIRRIDPTGHTASDAGGQVYAYQKLVWAADQKRLYDSVDLAQVADPETSRQILLKKESLADKTGGDSILTLYLTVDLDKAYFSGKSNPHLFYTPERRGLNNKNPDRLVPEIHDRANRRFIEDRPAIINWLRAYLELTTYEISCPVLRDEQLAPAGQTGLIISTLMDYQLVRHIADAGWYDAFKAIAAEIIVNILDATIYAGFKEKIIDSFVSTPLTLARITGNSDGAITGWAFTNKPIPAVSSLAKVARSIETPIPDVLQAGQWVFSPSGLPISILTGKLAADAVIKQLR